LAAVESRELTDSDQAAYADAAVRTGASRWAADDAPFDARRTGLAVVTRSGQPGQTCVSLVDARRDAAQPLLERCTYGIVWSASASVNAAGSALALAVQPLATWRELWVFHRVKGRWVADVLPPANDVPELG